MYDFQRVSANNGTIPAFLAPPPRRLVAYADHFSQPGRRPNNRVVEPLEPDTDKGLHLHFLHKEIHEQARVTRGLLGCFTRDRDLASRLPFDLARLRRLILVGNGTSFHAAEMAKPWFETLAGLTVEVEQATEYRYRARSAPTGEAAILLSGAGDGADIQACQESFQYRAVPTLALVNEPDSRLARGADGVLPLLAGPQRGSVSTKVMLAQLVLLQRLALLAAGLRGAEPMLVAARLRDLQRLPELIETVLSNEILVELATLRLAGVSNCLILGQGNMWPLAATATRLMQDMAFLPATALPGGALQHGPLALVGPDLPVIGLLSDEAASERTATDLRAAMARGARPILIGDAAMVNALDDESENTVPLPTTPSLLQPILATIPLQFLAYHAAVRRGIDVDRPQRRPAGQDAG